MTRPKITGAVGTIERKALEVTFPDPRSVRAFEDLQSGNSSVVEGINGLIDDTNEIETDPFLVFDTPSSLLTNTKRLQGGTDITVTMGSAVTLALTDTGVTAGSYGSASKVPTFTVGPKGRLTVASDTPLITTNITEGANLYFTSARALAAVVVPVPATATSPGTKGQIAVTPGFLYVCVAASQWERVATATF